MRKIPEILKFLDQREQKKLYRFVLLSLLSPVAELFSVSMLLPVLSEAFESTATDKLLAKILFLGLVLLFIGGFELIKNRTSTGLVMDISHSWSTKIYELYVMEELKDHNKRTADQARAAARSDVSHASGLITTAISLIVDFLKLLAYFCVLIYTVRLAGTVCCAAVIALIAGLYRGNYIKITKFGEVSRRLEIKASGIVSTAYGAYKEIKIDARKNFLQKKYTQASAEYAQIQKDYAYIKGIQGIVLENVTEAGLFFLLAFALAAGVDLPHILPEAMVFLVLLLRTIPIAKQIVSELTSLNFGRRYLNEVLSNLKRYRQLKKEEKELETLRKKHLSLQKGIRVQGLTFRYPNGKLILDQAEIEIPAGKSTVVIGPSGEGKTTFLDLVLGLLHPQAGHIWYDDYDIAAGADEAGPCQASLGELVSYIPQIVYLNNETVRNNVVFMAEENAGDENRIIDCLKYAQIWEDVRQMPNGLDTLIGENGISISGGQRQRIALARALYKDFEILIMDEATAALDMDTEQAVLDSIRQLKGNKTLLMVTHHMTLADACDHVYRLENHKLRKVR